MRAKILEGLQGSVSGSVVACLPALVRIASGARVMDVIAEVASCLEISGVSRVDWLRYRKLKGVGSANLSVTLNMLEDEGLFCRDVSKGGSLMRWDLVWVNPGVLRHVSARTEFLPGDMRRFKLKRERWLKVKHDPSFSDPAGALMAMNENCAFVTAKAQKITITFKTGHFLRVPRKEV